MSPVAVILASAAGWGGQLPGSVRVDLGKDDMPLTAGFEEVYRIGAPRVLLSKVRSAEFGADGTLYVLDAQSSSSVRLMAIRDNGKSVRDIGRPGGGPGEFRAVPHFAPLSDGRLAVFDVGHNAYHIFSSDGTLERMVNAGGSGLRAGFANMARTVRPDRVGGGFMMVSPISWDTSDETWASETRANAIERVRMGADNVVTESVVSAWAPPRQETEVTVAGRTIVMSGGLVFEPQLHFDVFVDGRVAYSDSTAYQINIASPEGEVVRILERPFEAEPVTDQIRSDVKAAQARKFKELGALQFFSADMLDDMLEVYHEIPVVEGLKVGWRDKIWIQRRHSDVLWRPANYRENPDKYPSGPVDVLSAEGAYLGTFGPENSGMPLAFGPGGMVATVEADALDVPTIVVSRLPEKLR